jgi:hypothetical protein
MRPRSFVFAALLAGGTLFSSLSGQVLTGSGSYKNAGPGWDRGMETTVHCGNNPESWVRGTAKLDKETKVLSVTIQLETDSVLAGPKGRVTVVVRSSEGQTVFTVASDEVGIGGKPPGRAVIRDFTSTTAIPAEIARRAASLYLDAQCTGSITRPFNIDLGNASKAFNLIASAPALEVSSGSPESKRLVSAAEALASTLFTKGSPEYTAAFRKEIAQGAVQFAEFVSPGSLDLDGRYRSNFSGQGRIWGGDPAVPGTFPDTVAIYGNQRLCTGTVIGPKAILTAAHCVCGGVTETVYFGDSVYNAISTVPVASGTPMTPCTPHFQIEAGDVAVLTVSAELSVTPRVLASGPLAGAAKVGRAVGFGVGANQITDPAGIKRMVDIPVASVTCGGTVKTPAGQLVADSAYYNCTSGREIVAGAPSLDRDTCNGDSGGPLFVQALDGKLYLAGITSRPTGTPGTRPCGDGGIYVKTDDPVIDWLHSLNIHPVVGPSQ